MASSPTLETLLVRQLLAGFTLFRHLMHARGICAYAVAHGATPHQKKGLLCQHYARCFERPNLCRHTIRRSSRCTRARLAGGRRASRHVRWPLERGA